MRTTGSEGGDRRRHRARPLCGIALEVGSRRCHTFWLARPIGGRPRAGAESVAVGYYERDRALGMIARDDFREELARCLAAEKRPFYLTRP